MSSWYKQKINWPNWIMAITTIAIMFITFFYMLAAFEQVTRMKETLKETQEAVNAAKKSGDVAEAANRLNKELFTSRERPWVKFINCELAGPIIGEGNSFQLIMRYQLKNVGMTPAKNVHADFSIYPLKNQQLTGNDEINIVKNACNIAKSHFYQSGKFIFPNDISGVANPITFDVDPHNLIENSMKQLGIDSTKSLLLIGYIIYNFTFDETIHTTAITYMLSRNDDKPIYPIEKHGVAFGNRRVDGIELNKLHLSNTFMGEYAD